MAKEQTHRSVEQNKSPEIDVHIRLSAKVKGTISTSSIEKIGHSDAKVNQNLYYAQHTKVGQKLIIEPKVKPETIQILEDT